MTQRGCWFALTRSVSLCCFWCTIMLFSPKPIYKGWYLQDSLQSGRFVRKELYHHRAPSLPLTVHIRWHSALVHLTFLSHDLTSPSSSAPGAQISFLPGNKELFSPPLLSSFCKTYMLHVLPSLQMLVTPSSLGRHVTSMLSNRDLSYRDVWVALRNRASKMFLKQIFSSNRKRRNNTTLPSKQQQ